MNCKEIAGFLDKELELEKFKSDSALNGLQVENLKEINKAGLAVDASMDTFLKAKSENCDIILVHHGLFWGGNQPLTDEMFERVRFLVQNDIALYACHLPLDAHKIHGNNVQMFDLLGVNVKGEFEVPRYGPIGYYGDYRREVDVNEVIEELNNKLGTSSTALLFGKQKIKRVFVITGKVGSQEFKEAITQGADVFITGEITHSVYHLAKEQKVNFIAAGHYATETLGVKALGRLLEKKYKLKTEFLDVPTGI